MLKDAVLSFGLVLICVAISLFMLFGFLSALQHGEILLAWPTYWGGFILATVLAICIYHSIAAGRELRKNLLN